MQKRRIAGLLALMMTASVVVAGCGSGQGTSTEDTESTAVVAGEEAAADTEEQAGTDEDASDGTGAAASDAAAALTDLGTVEYTWLIDANESSDMYEEYEDGPIYQYWSSMDWEVPADGTIGKISIDFTAPPADNSDYGNTLLATGEYPDVFSTAQMGTGIIELYEEGIALDLTDYVDKYMPNYKRRMEESRYGTQLYNTVDGEKRILQIYQLNDRSNDPWCGYLYRRDWIVKYGKDADGNAFTGGWNADGEWEDDVVFPSGNTDPVYVSDWEWMLGIFEDALDDLGLTDGYAMQLNFMGYTPFGDLTSGFGGVGGWYLDEDGICRFGATNDGMRAYLECMATWYENGWINKGFEENTSDIMFWQVDTPSVYSGKVGCFYGMTSAVGDSLDSKSGDETDPLNGICLCGAATPINDVYGDASVQNHDPFMSFGTQENPYSVVFSNRLDEDEIGLLMTAVDYLYSDEGSLLATRGFSDEQQAEIQDEFYNKYGLEDGAYTVLDNGDIQVNPALTAIEGVENAARMIRTSWYANNDDVDYQYPQMLQKAVELWSMYPNTGSIMSAVTGQMTSEQTSEYATATSNIRTVLNQEIPRFITGETDITNDADWQAMCDAVDVYEPEKYCDIINEILGN